MRWLVKKKFSSMLNLKQSLYSFWQELEEIRKSGMKNFRNIQVDESNILTWQGLIVPVSPFYLLLRFLGFFFSSRL